MSNELKDIYRIRKLLLETHKKVVVDNDFERAYNIPFDSFETIDKKDLIEVLYILVAVLYENDIELELILDSVEEDRK